MKPAAFFAGTAVSACCLLAVLATVCFFAFVSATSVMAQSLALTITNEAGARLMAIPVLDGSRFAIRYTHSVAKTPVTDFFAIKENAIWLDKTVYHDFGAGLPHNPEPGQTMAQRDGELIISGYNRKLPQFALRVGRVANHVLLIFKDSSNENVAEEIRLDTLAPPGSALSFAVARTD